MRQASGFLSVRTRGRGLLDITEEVRRWLDAHPGDGQSIVTGLVTSAASCSTCSASNCTHDRTLVRRSFIAPALLLLGLLRRLRIGLGSIVSGVGLLPARSLGIAAHGIALRERDLVITVRLRDSDFVGVAGRVVVEIGQFIADLSGRVGHILVGALLGTRNFRVCLVLCFRDFGGHLVRRLRLMACREHEGAERQRRESG
jgi:hypothetical protein